MPHSRPCRKLASNTLTEHYRDFGSIDIDQDLEYKQHVLHVLYLRRSSPIRRVVSLFLFAIFLFPSAVARKKSPKQCATSLAKCPNVGCGKLIDKALNAQKNRKATPAASKVKDLDSLDDVANLDLPDDWEAGRPRNQLKGFGEGQPVRVAAYVLEARAQRGFESCNCFLPNDVNKDIHFVVVKKSVLNKPEEEREGLSQTAEMTPHFRKKHTLWTAKDINNFIKATTNKALLVRITGYQMVDTEHFIHLHLKRKNDWEVHPITQFEFCETGDDCTVGSAAGWKKLK